jgi:hypothetical protein
MVKDCYPAKATQRSRQHRSPAPQPSVPGRRLCRKRLPGRYNSSVNATSPLCRPLSRAWEPKEAQRNIVTVTPLLPLLRRRNSLCAGIFEAIELRPKLKSCDSGALAGLDAFRHRTRGLDGDTEKKEGTKFDEP